MENVKMVVFLLLFVLGCQSKKATVGKANEILMSKKLAALANDYFDNFAVTDSIRLIQIVKVLSDTSEYIFHDFGTYSSFLNSYEIIGRSNLKSGDVYIGLAKNSLMQWPSHHYEIASKFYDYCPCRVILTADSVLNVNMCYNIPMKKDSVVNFEDIEIKK
jgi:hypothetical protein